MQHAITLDEDDDELDVDKFDCKIQFDRVCLTRAASETYLSRTSDLLLIILYYTPVCAPEGHSEGNIET